MIIIIEYKISIIVPIYNSEKHIKKCIDSIINQTYYNIEIILVNDGSTDASFDIISEYKNNDNRIHIINQKNSGGIIARKNGVENSTGQYCLIIDSDDWIEKNTIEVLVNYLNQYPNVDVIKFGFISEPGKRIKNKYLENDAKHFFINEHLNNEIFNLLMYTSEFNNIWNSIIKRNIFDFDSYIFKNIVHKSEDLLINLQLYTKAKSYLLVDDVLYHYYTESNGITNNHSISKIISNINDSLYIRKIREKIAIKIHKEYNTNLMNKNYFLFIINQIYNFLIYDNCSNDSLILIQNELLNKGVYDYFNNIKLKEIHYKNIFYRIIAKKIISREIDKLYIYSIVLKQLKKLKRRLFKK